jgi:hypothetical protein
MVGRGESPMAVADPRDPETWPPGPKAELGRRAVRLRNLVLFADDVDYHLSGPGVSLCPAHGRRPRPQSRQSPEP